MNQQKQKISDPWLSGYRDGSDQVPQRIPEDEQYLEGYRVGERHAASRNCSCGKTENRSIFEFEAE